MNKYRAKKTEYRSIQGFTRTYDSKREAARAAELDNLLRDRSVTFWLPQPAFPLPGKVTYRADFEIHWADGTTTYEDVKGVQTEAFKVKKRQVEDLFPVEIQIVK